MALSVEEEKREIRSHSIIAIKSTIGQFALAQYETAGLLQIMRADRKCQAAEFLAHIT
jgi:predicted XRE-type DNA-binding protein